MRMRETVSGLEKPPYLHACNGCGLCCLAGPCAVAETILKVEEGRRCPALVFESGRYWCDLVRGNGHNYVDGLSSKPWAGEALAKVLRASGGWTGQCDSQIAEELEIAR